MKRTLLIPSLLLFIVTSCSQFKKGEGDLQYKIITDNQGPLIREGDFVAIKVIQKTEEDSVLFNSWTDDRSSFIDQRKPMFKGDLYSALGLLSEGDSATFKINIDSMTQKMNMPKPEYTKGKYMVYVVKIEKVIPKGADEKAFNDNVQKYFTAQNDILKSKESGKISAYIASKGLKPEATASGLKYVVTKASTGPTATPGDTVVVDYTGSFVTGKVFDTSVKADAIKAKMPNTDRPFEPIKVVVGMKAAIDGFDEALQLFPAGTKVTVIIPSNLAYGQGDQTIPPYSPLIFDLDIIKVNKK
jgi:FKBP-type peptidyl-prolyl cis-trans isomerase FkpA